MPGGMISVDARNTFALAILIAADRKMNFETGAVEMTRGDHPVPKWSIKVAVTYLADEGRTPVSEVISVSISGNDPISGVPVGSPVEFDRLRCSVMAPTLRGKERITGGAMFFMADAIKRSAGQPVNGSRPAAPVPAGKSE